MKIPNNTFDFSQVELPTDPKDGATITKFVELCIKGKYVDTSNVSKAQAIIGVMELLHNGLSPTFIKYLYTAGKKPNWEAKVLAELLKKAGYDIEFKAEEQCVPDTEGRSLHEGDRFTTLHLYKNKGEPNETHSSFSVFFKELNATYNRTGNNDNYNLKFPDKVRRQMRYRALTSAYNSLGLGTTAELDREYFEGAEPTEIVRDIDELLEEPPQTEN